ncbi:MAG TPA: hypothetical protein VF651_04030 [Gammaproteobacteria bacterium]
MRKSSSMLRRLLAAAVTLLLADGAAAANHFYVPFTLTLGAGGDKGVWLADTDHLGNPPYQITNQVLDAGGQVAVLDDWSYNAVSHMATNVQPQMLVYGLNGHLYKVDLHRIQPVAQYSSGSYAELCSLTALDERPFAAAKAYVQAVVEPVVSVNDCASGLGTQTWLIPAGADASTAPMIQPAHWTVLGAFTDPTDDSFVRWVVWTGNSVDAYKANFSSHTTLLVGPPAGPAPFVLGRQDGVAFLVSPSDDGTNHTDALYRVTMTASGLVTSFSYADSSPCTGFTGGSFTDPATGVLLFAEPTSTGYAVYTAPLAGGAPSAVYADASGGECAGLGGDGPSAGHLGLNEVDMSTGFQHVIVLSEAGPVGQTPVLVAGGGANQNAFLRYTIAGRYWIDVRDFSFSPVQFTAVVANGDGSVATTYANSRIGDDLWGGFRPSGAAAIIERDFVYLFSPNPAPCSGGSLAAIETVGLTGTAISGVPADACNALAYGWAPASVGYVQQAGGSSPVEIDPVGGKLYFLLGPDPDGTFQNLSLLPGYPFF